VAQENIIETCGLTRRFGALTAVSNLNLEVPAGSIYGFLGPNGAGKTTTIRMLLGLIRPDAGLVRLFGRPLASRYPILRRVGAFVETPSIYPHLTGRENLEITRCLLRVPVGRLDQALAIVGLESAADRRARDYSQGMLQRLGLALALLGEVDLLILDEPTNGLDPAGISPWPQEGLKFRRPGWSSSTTCEVFILPRQDFVFQSPGRFSAVLSRRMTLPGL